MSLSIDEMRAKMNSIAVGAPVPVVKLQESSDLSGGVSSSAAVEAMRNQLMGKLVTPTAAPVTESIDEFIVRRKSEKSVRPQTHSELLEAVLNNKVAAAQEETAHRDHLRSMVPSSRLSLIEGLL